ncbi:MAG: hypothetical protein PHS31_00855 [Victivallaceae bacterium]|nr:hypothetical protein [Victivallaceae bacterium]MDD4180849.1 hypothetical protein [Victivallaceae bacterium]
MTVASVGFSSSGEVMLYVGAFTALAFSAIGSVFGAGIGGAAAIGAWKKCYVQKRPAPFQLVILSGMPLSQTIYGMIMMFLIISLGSPAVWPVYVCMGVLGGLAIGASAWYQGKAAAAACDSFGDTGEGFTNYLMVLGIIETVAIFVLAFGIVVIVMSAAVAAPEVAPEVTAIVQ